MPNFLVTNKFQINMLIQCVTLSSNFASASRLKPTKQVNFNSSALFWDFFRSTSKCCWMVSGIPIPASVPSVYGEPITPIELEIPISDIRLQMVVNVYARQESSLFCTEI